MHKLDEFGGKSERVRIAMLIDDVEEHAEVIARQIVEGHLNDDHFCQMTRIELEDLDDEIRSRGLGPTDSLRGEIKGIYKRQLKYELKSAGFRDICEVKHNGKYWFRFYKW